MGITDWPAAFGLHKSMFVKTLTEQSNEEQTKLFVEPAKKFEIIGASPSLPSAARQTAA